MQFITLLATLSAVAATVITEEDHHTLISRPELIEAVKLAKTTWTPAVNVRFANATVADVKKLLGTVLPHEKGYIAPELVRTNFKFSASDIPDNFDAREAWPKCASVIGRVRDQSSCGSCWAFGSTEAFNDRQCIVYGDAATIYAPEDTVSCCTGAQCSFSMGCNGGQPSGAWNWFVKTGVSTGGDYADIGSGSTCKPYSLPSCAHHVTPPEGMVACDTLPEYSTPKCTSSCDEKTYGVKYADDKKKAKSSYAVKSAQDMQLEIMERGTVSVSMTVYEDFETYSSGIYQHVSGKNLGGHAIKAIGWGVENGVKYWICVNSWNPSWGEGGMFRILRGSDECGIESGTVAGEV